jgi:hypothetical protein
MSASDRTRARRARDKLVQRLSSARGFVMVDIASQEGSEAPVLRVHLRGGRASALDVPAEIDGIPVRVLDSDLGLE